MIDFSEQITQMINQSVDIIKKSISLNSEINITVDSIVNSIKNGNKLIIFGNGGSAADAQHIAAELVGRFKKERRGLAAIALTTDSSALTCIGNDYGYEKVFERQVEALANKDDVVIGISTGGTSKNVVQALEAAREIGCSVVGLSGKNGGAFNVTCHVNIVVPSKETARIQEMHILIGHIICQLIDDEFT